MAAYFDPAEGFAGMSFCTLGHNPPGAVTADDLLAVSLLDIAWRPEAVPQLLGIEAGRVSAMLSTIPCRCRSVVGLRRGGRHGGPALGRLTGNAGRRHRHRVETASP